MAKASLRLAERMIEAGQPVVSNTGSFVGDWKFDDDGFAYVVSSYGVPVAELRRHRVVDANGQRVMNERGQAKYNLELWITPVKYSVTTSKHTTIAKRALNIQLLREAENNG